MYHFNPRDLISAPAEDESSPPRLFIGFRHALPLSLFLWVLLLAAFCM